MSDYTPLRAILDEALAQSAEGKGAERHARGQDFVDQPILRIARVHGVGFVTGQAAKKTDEAAGMISRGETDAAVRELLGAIVYAAAAVISIRERMTSGTDKLHRLLAAAQARYDALSPEEQAEADKRQRESWVRGQIGMGSDRDEAEARHGIVKSGAAA